MSFIRCSSQPSQTYLEYPGLRPLSDACKFLAPCPASLPRGRATGSWALDSQSEDRISRIKHTYTHSVQTMPGDAITWNQDNQTVQELLCRLCHCVHFLFCSILFYSTARIIILFYSNVTLDSLSQDMLSSVGLADKIAGLFVSWIDINYAGNGRSNSVTFRTGTLGLGIFLELTTLKLLIFNRATVLFLRRKQRIVTLIYNSEKSQSIPQCC